MGWSQRLGTIGVWRGVNDVGPELAGTIEGFGDGTIWQGGSPDAQLRQAEELLDTTQSIHVATGVVNIWKSDAAELANWYQRIEANHPGRLLLGIGSGRREATPERVRPIEAMAGYLDVLDAHGVRVEARVLSALGPRMLALAGGTERRDAPVPHRSLADAGGPRRPRPGRAGRTGADRRPGCRSESARRTARSFLRRYLGMINYTSTMRRGGFSDADIAGEGSDLRVDRTVVHGDAGVLAGRTSPPRCGCRSRLRPGATSREDIVPASGPSRPSSASPPDPNGDRPSLRR